MIQIEQSALNRLLTRYVDNRRSRIITLLFALAHSLEAQTSLPQFDPPPPSSSASIAGVVHDTHGAVLNGVRVTLTGQDNSIKRAVEADENGAFSFADLHAGTYLV